MSGAVVVLREYISPEILYTHNDIVQKKNYYAEI